MDIRNAQVDAILSRRREEAVTRGEERRDSFYTRYPRLLDLDKQIQICKSDILLQLATAPKSPPNYSALFSLETEKRVFMQLEKIPEDFDRPVPFCHLCGDLGMSHGDICVCYRELSIPGLLQDGGLFDYREITFSSYREDLYSEPDKMALIRNLCGEYALAFPGNKKNMLFLGRPGTGKTFMALCVANDVVAKGVAVYFARMNELLDVMNAYRIQMLSFSPDAELLTALVRKRQMIFEADLLIIDELGVEAKGQNTTADLLEILGSRQVKRLATLITSNLTAADLQKNYDNRLYSRLFGDFSIVAFTGNDIRLHPAYKTR